MWWVRSDRPAQAFVGRRILAWCGPDQAIRVCTVDGVESALDRLAAHCAEDKPKTLRVWLGGAVSRLERLPAIDGVRSREEAEAACTATLKAPASGAAAIVRLPCWPYMAPHWCAAVTEGGVLPRLRTIRHARLRSIRPWWSWAVNRLTDQQGATVQPGALAMFDGESVVACEWDAQRGVAAAATAAPMADTEAVRRFVARRAAGSTLGVSARIVSLKLHSAEPRPEKESDADFAFYPMVSMTDAA